MPSWRDAIHDASDGCSIDVEVTPGAKTSAFPSGYNAWRARIEARVQAPPEDGQANEALVGLVAAALGVPRSAVRVGAGATSRRKTLLVSGLKAEETRALLAAKLG